MKKNLLQLSTYVFTSLPIAILGQVGINTYTPSATLDIITKAPETKSLEINNTSDVETFTVLDNGNVGIADASPLVPVHFKLNNTPTTSATSIGSQNYDVTGFISDQTLQAASTNANNTQSLFQGIFSYTGSAKNNNVFTVNAVSRPPALNSYSSTNALNVVSENINTSNGTISAINAVSRSSANIGTLTGSMIGFSNDTGTAVLATGLSVKNSNAAGANITNYKGIDISNLTNSGSITNTTGIFIGSLTAGTQTSKYSIQSTDITAGMWHRGRLSLTPLVDPNTTGTQLTTSSLAVAIDGDTTLPTSGFGASQNTIVMGDGFVTTNPTYTLPNPNTAKGRLYTIIVTSSMSPVNLSAAGGANIYHITDTGEYLGEASYTLQKGSRTYISDGFSWYVTASTTEQNVSGNYPN
ncbi:hypothetical protein HNP38_001819 [Chryseobacterium defluvii]|uniref:Uncharacterized protein n=1 Tax=Chryseobacterium defluvii TaxID=160396 RepID=A0A840KG69_9FLAO|nr:hypothetical protein [Chryseobacterium defluvii]MBB4806523.1 hypothetical protein [Chryseobacterium defluvii]